MNYHTLTLVAAVAVISTTGLVFAQDVSDGRRGHDPHIADIKPDYDPATIPTDDGMPTPETPDSAPRGEHEMKGVHEHHEGDHHHKDMKKAEEKK